MQTIFVDKAERKIVPAVQQTLVFVFCQNLKIFWYDDDVETITENHLYTDSGWNFYILFWNSKFSKVIRGENNIRREEN